MAKQLREYSRQTQRKSNDVNTSALFIEEELEDEFKDILSSIVNEEYIISVTGIKDLSKVEYISLQLDTKEQALYDLSEILPNLKHLVLDNSHIGSIRDLGTGLRSITSLSLSGCNLRDLDGIGVLVGLQELCLSDNLLSDISPLTLHENLENLNLSNNRIADLTFGVVLASCPKLRSLFLNKNPIERLSKYRAVVSYLLTGLDMLDGTPIDTTSNVKFSSSLMDDAHEELNLIREDINDELRLDDDIFEDAIGHKDGDRSYLIPIGSSPRLHVGENLPDTGSELTHGSAIVLAGNVAAAMRKRRVGGDSLNDSSLLHDDNETTLDILDHALRAKTPTTRSHVDKVSFVAEGDITEIVLGSPQRKPQLASSPVRSTAGKASHSGKGSVSISFDADGPMHSANRRPKTAFSGTSLRSSDKGYEHQSSNSNTPEKHLKDDNRPHSPRQKNSSRPQSATVSPAEVTSLFNDRNLPFVVSRDTFRIHGDEDSEEDEIPRTRDIVVKREIKETPRDKLAAKGSSGSLVHQNMVRRFKGSDGATSSTTTAETLLKKPLPSIGDDFHISDDSDEDEELAVNHSDRLRFMISKKDDKIAALNKSRQATLKKLQGQSIVDQQDEEGESSITQSKDRTTPRQSIPGNANEKVSTSVEKKLGFNLAGSLAAIDRWVQDVDSGEDESESENYHSKNIPNVTDKSTVAMGREAHITTTAPARPPTGKEKILSRDAIFHLCWNASEKRPDSRSSSRPSSGARKGSVGSIGSEQDTSVASESDYQPKIHVKPAVDRRSVAADYIENVGQSTPKPSNQQVSHSKQPGSRNPLPKQQDLCAVQMSDKELIDLLRKPPKTVLALRTKASFQEFFRGIEMDRFKSLLHEAYADIPDVKDRESKIARRMSLMEAS